MAMCGNGVPTGMERILQQHKQILQAPLQVRPALFVAAAGTAMLRIAVQPIATATTRAAATVSGFACLSPRSSFLVESFKVKRLKSKGKS